MKTLEAIDVVVGRGGNPFEWDHELMEAAELLATEVSALRKIVRDELYYRQKRCEEDRSIQARARLIEAMEIKSRFDSR